MPHAKATIGTTNYEVSITTGEHQLKSDEGMALGGQNVGPAPYDLLCAALGACTAITLRMYAERKGWQLNGVHVNVHYIKHESEEGKIDRLLSFEGELSDEQRARLADIAERTPVTLTLKQGVMISTRLT